MPDRRRASWLALAALAVLALAGLGRWVVQHDAGLQYDDAGYLTRGLFHAAQVREKGNLLLPRLAWSLRFEAPKPPLFHGLLAATSLACGAGRVRPLLVVGTLLPLAAVLAALFALGRSAGGNRAGAAAVLMYLATPLALPLATRLLVETTLAATVTATVACAYRRTETGSGAYEIWTGLGAGLASLTKLLGPLFVTPAVLIAAVRCARRESVAAASRFLAVAGAVALLVAAPWYERNLNTAFSFARYARTHWPSMFEGGPWERPLHFVLSTFGPVMGTIVALLAVAAWRTPDRRARPLALLTAASAVVSGLVVISQPVFDPRFWLPGMALVIGWAGTELANRSSGWSVTTQRIVVSGLLGLIAWRTYILHQTPQPRMPWRATEIVDSTASAYPPPAQLCTLGSTPGWNLEKLRLAAELSNVRPRPEAFDLLVAGSADAVRGRLARCQVVFSIAAGHVGPTSAERRVNAGLVEAWTAFEATREQFDEVPAAARGLGNAPPVQVWVRRGAPR